MVAVPVMIGRLSPVTSGVTTGAAGGVVSMVTGTKVTGLVLPAGSVAVTRTSAVPLARVWVGVTLQTPPVTVAVKTSPVPGMTTVMVSPSVPVPLMVGVVSLVMLSVLMPLSLDAATSAGGAVGGVVSTSTVSVSVPVTP